MAGGSGIAIDAFVNGTSEEAGNAMSSTSVALKDFQA